jgi:hypothetical protein
VWEVISLFIMTPGRLSGKLKGELSSNALRCRRPHSSFTVTKIPPTMSEDPTKALVLMILTRPLDAAPFPPPRTDPWQSQPLAVYPFSSIGSEALKVDLFVIWAVMKGYDQNAELSPIMPGTYRLVNGEEPMVGFNLWVRRRRIMVVWKCRSCIGWRSRSTILRV